MSIRLEQARALLDAVAAAAQGQGMTVAAVVVAPGGWPVMQICMDNAFPASADAALAKARTAALYRRPSSDFSRRVKEGMPLAHLPHVVPLGGGVLLEQSGTMLGALGISGAREESETALAESLAEAFAGGAI